MKKLLFLLLPILGMAQSPDATPIENIILENATKKNNATRIVVQDTITKQLHWKLQSSLVFPTNISIGNRTATTLDVLSSTGTGFTFPSASATEAGLLSATKFLEYNAKISGSGTTNFIPKFTSSGTIGNSSIFENGIGSIGIGTSTPNAFFGKTIDVFGANGASLLMRGGSVEAVLYANNGGQTAGFGTSSNTPLDILIQGVPKARFSTLGNLLINTETDNGIEKLQVNGTVSASPATLSNQLVTKSQLDLKANLASPALTGTPTAPTPTEGTNTTQIATTAFVTGAITTADAGNVKLTGSQTITGQKTLISPIVNNQLNLFGSGSGSGIISFIDTPDTYFTQTGIARIGSFMAFIGSGGSTKKPLLFDSSLLNTVSRKVRFQDVDGTVALTSNLLYTNQTITANKTVTISEFVLNNELILSVNAASGNITITLPTFTALQGYKVTVKKMDSSANTVSITGVGGVNIDGASTLIISGQYGTATVGANLSQYIIL